MIFPIIRTAWAGLRRDGAALALSFVLPIVFFSIFAVIFGGHRDGMPKVAVIVVDLDHSTGSQRLVKGLQSEGSLNALVRPEAKKGVQQPDYTAATAEAAIKAGTASVALIIPPGYGANPISFGPNPDAPQIEMLRDASDEIAPQVVTGLLQKVVMTSMPDVLMDQGTKMMDQYAGGLTAQQRKYMDDAEARLRNRMAGGDAGGKGVGLGNMVPVKERIVVGENKDMVSFYAAAIGVMFLLFTTTGAAGSLLDEAESGTMDRVLSSRVTMTSLLGGKLGFNMLLAFAQLTLMFLWAKTMFKLDLFSHLPGFIVMGLVTAFAVSAFGLLLASVCATRAQLGSLSTLLILVMSSVGGSMFPRFLMPLAMQKAGLFTINAWAIDGFTKVFWRDEPVSHLWPQVAVLLAAGIVLFAIARRLARRWEFS
jgi:ABC-2 type transport system permease protein